MRHLWRVIIASCLLGICVVGTVFLVLPFTRKEVIPFVIGFENGPTTLDPVNAYDSETIDTLMQVCEGLYRYNYSSPELECIPCLADEMGTWSVNGTGDRVILDIPLKRGVLFHDGSKFNASAVKWNFDRLQYWTYGWDVDGGDIYTLGDGIVENNALGIESMSFFAIEGTPILNHTEIVDEYAIRFVFNMECEVWDELLTFIACSVVLPDSNYEYGDTFINRIASKDELIGTGPFKLMEYVVDDKVVFDYNPNYHMTWGDDHIEKMIYLIVPDIYSRSMLLWNHEIHWGIPIFDWIRDEYHTELIEIRHKTSVAYYIQMNLNNMRWEYRYASSLIWNQTYFLDYVFNGKHYQLHVPVPDGMEYHHEGFNGEPKCDIRSAQLVLLNSTDSEIQANLTSNNLSPVNTTVEWRAIAESTTPVAEFNFTRYQSSFVELCAIFLQDYLKDIGIKLNILDTISWDEWKQYYLLCPENSTKLCYSIGGWIPDINDPINMIEPLYGTNSSRNCFGLDNSTWNQKLIDTYSATGDDRRNLFYDIQEDFCLYQIPSFYIMQLEGVIGFNRDYIDADSVGDLLNKMRHLYWFNVRFTPPDEPMMLGTKLGLIFLGVIGIGLGIYISVNIVRDVKTKNFSSQRSV